MAISTGNSIAGFAGSVATQTVGTGSYIVEGWTTGQAVASGLVGQKVHIGLTVGT